MKNNAGKIKKNGSSFFSNKECEYFPCHRGADAENFNCLFCYCPLYALGDSCGGNFCYTEDGIKNCENCLLPHSEGGYERITNSFEAIAEMMKADILINTENDRANVAGERENAANAGTHTGANAENTL